MEDAESTSKFTRLIFQFWIDPCFLLSELLLSLLLPFFMVLLLLLLSWSLSLIFRFCKLFIGSPKTLGKCKCSIFVLLIETITLQNVADNELMIPEIMNEIQNIDNKLTAKIFIASFSLCMREFLIYLLTKPITLFRYEL
jgi:hypothetical protein